jgi:hypothetical protein
MRTTAQLSGVVSALVLVLATAALAACGPRPTATGGSGGTAGKPSTGPCDLNSGYEGDDMCLPPPEPGKGIQLHVGPKAYDAASVAPFLLGPGQEKVECYYQRSSNTAPMYYFNQKIRLRPHTHHLIMTIMNQDIPEGWGPCQGIGGNGPMGSQTAVRDIPDTADIAPENKGLARTLPANALIQHQLHYYNFGETPILREAWVNLYSMEESEATQRASTMFMIGGLDLAVPPGAKQIAKYTCTASSAGRIYDIFGHYHAHTVRFSVERVRQNERLKVYDSFDWMHPANYTYDSVHKNPVADRERRVDGAYSGILDVQPQDVFEWECEIHNTSQQVLRFANEVQTGEMCINFGSFVPTATTGRGGLGCITTRGTITTLP